MGLSSRAIAQHVIAYTATQPNDRASSTARQVMGVGYDRVLLATTRLSGPNLKVVPKRERSPVRTRHRTASGPAAYWEHGRGLPAYNPGSSPKPPYTEHRAMPVSEPPGASRHRLDWLLLAGLLLLLCLAGCTSRRSGGAATDRAGVASSSPVPPVSTVTPVSTPLPTLTPTPWSTPTLSPIPTLLPTPTPTPTWMRPPTPTPSLKVSGDYEDPVAHADGHYELQLAGARVAASFSTSRSPVPYGVREMPPPLFTVPEPFRPPYPVLRSAEGTPVLADGAPDPDHPEPRRFLLRVDPDGTVRYADDNHVEGVGYLAYALDTAWGTTPAANDRAVLEILDAHWFRKTLLSAVPPPEQFEVPAREMRMGDVMRTIPATRLGAFVTFDADGRVTALGAPTRAIGSDEESPGYHFHGPLLPELGQLHRLEHLDLGYRHVEAHPAGWTRRQIVAASLDRDGSILVDMGALTGAIPPQLGQLARLRYLDLQGQLLAGPLPPEMGRLASLEYLDLGSNWLAGPLPPELGQLTNLQTLDLSGNRLIAFPPELGSTRQSGTSFPDEQSTDRPPAPRVGPACQLAEARPVQQSTDGAPAPGMESTRQPGTSIPAKKPIVGFPAPRMGPTRPPQVALPVQQPVDGFPAPRVGPTRQLAEARPGKQPTKGAPAPRVDPDDQPA